MSRDEIMARDATVASQLASCLDKAQTRLVRWMAGTTIALVTAVLSSFLALSTRLDALDARIIVAQRQVAALDERTAAIQTQLSEIQRDLKQRPPPR